MHEVLCLSGGGIRGVVTAVILDYMECAIGHLRSRYSLIAGTSTGGILACCAAVDMPMRAARDIYEKEGHRIFSRGARVIDHAGLILPKYPSSGLEFVLKEYLRNNRLSDCVCDILVTSWDHRNNKSVIMTSHEQRLKPAADGDLFLWEVGMRTSAAPTYFPSAEGHYYDGGVFANNPSLCAVAELLSWGVPLSDIRVISIGTGAKPYRPMCVGLEGAIGVLPHIANIFMDSGADAVDYICTQLLGDRYISIQTDLSGVSERMDDASPKHIAALIDAAKRTCSSLPHTVFS